MRGARLWIGIAGLVLLCGLLELTARVFLFGPAGLDLRRVDSVVTIFESGLLRPSEHAQLGYELAPDRRAYFKLVEFHTNEAGLRDRAYPLAKPPGAFRVAVLGSSFALPAGVAIEDSFHGRLERRLGAGASARPHEFLNFAVGAYHPLQVYWMLRLRALAYDPDLVLFCVTDLGLASLRHHVRMPMVFGGIPERGHAFFRSFLLAFARQRLGRLDPATGAIVWPHPAHYERFHRGRRKSIIARLGRLHAERVPVVLVRLGFDPAQVSPDERGIARLAGYHGLPYVDTLPAFAGTDPRRFWIHPLDPHPDGAAHAIFADVIEASLRARHLLP